MKLSIGNRLFLAVLLAFAAVAIAGVGLARWSFSGQSTEHAAIIELDHLNGLIDSLTAQYQQHGDWSFLPADAGERRVWLPQELSHLQQGAEAKQLSPTIGYRIGLLDAQGRYLAGAVASPAMIALASIDTARRDLVIDGKRFGCLVVAEPQNQDDELAVAFLVQRQGSLFAITVLGVMLSALAAALLALHFRGPIRQLAEAARKLGSGQFDTRLSIRRNDELGELSDTFNQVAQRLGDAERSRRQWVADTSHELRTPLSVLRGQIEAMQDGVRAATPDNIALMLRQVLSLAKLVDDLYDVARAEVGQLRYEMAANDLWRLMLDVVEGYQEKFHRVELSFSIAAPPARTTVRCDADRLRQVLANLLENCVRYTAGGGRIEINGAVADDQLHLTIDDSAPDVAEPLLERLGERFFRVEPSRSRQSGGTGLGLALCRQIVAAHQGRLLFAASPLGGLRVSLVLNLEG